MSQVYDEIYKIVQSIPKGRVLTYGLISDMIGKRMSAQGVGWALKALGSVKRIKESTTYSAKAIKRQPKKISKKAIADYGMDTVPWQRVVNSQGGTSTHKIATLPPGLQQHLLELEGVVFDDEGKIDLKEYLWFEGVR